MFADQLKVLHEIYKTFQENLYLCLSVDLKNGVYFKITIIITLNLKVMQNLNFNNIKYKTE